MMIRMMAAVAAVAAAVPAAATDWQAATTAEGGQGEMAVFLVDKDSLRMVGANRSADVYLVANEASLIMTVLVDCKARSWQIQNSVMDQGGQKTREGTGEWQKVDPGSTHDAVIDYVCTGGTKRFSNKNFGAGDPVAPARAWIMAGAK